MRGAGQTVVNFVGEKLKVLPGLLKSHDFWVKIKASNQF
jgi:hypothetical protein